MKDWLIAIMIVIALAVCGLGIGAAASMLDDCNQTPHGVQC